MIKNSKNKMIHALRIDFTRAIQTPTQISGCQFWKPIASLTAHDFHLGQIFLHPRVNRRLAYGDS